MMKTSPIVKTTRNRRLCISPGRRKNKALHFCWDENPCGPCIVAGRGIYPSLCILAGRGDRRLLHFNRTKGNPKGLHFLMEGYHTALHVHNEGDHKALHVCKEGDHKALHFGKVGEHMTAFWQGAGNTRFCMGGS